MSTNNKKNRPVDGPTKTAPVTVPATQSPPPPQMLPTVKVEEEPAHPLAAAMEAFVDSCAAYVSDTGSTRSTVVGPYRLAFNGPQLLSVAHV